MDNRTHLRSHLRRLGWTRRELQDYIERETGDRYSLAAIDTWLTDKDWQRPCPGMLIALIERDYPVAHRPDQ